MLSKVETKFFSLQECAPAFDYARASHTTEIIPAPTESTNGQTPKPLFCVHPEDRLPQIAIFTCPAHVDLDLRWVSQTTEEGAKAPAIELDYLDLTSRGHRGLGVISNFTLKEGESITFVLREPPTPTTSGIGKEVDSEQLSFRIYK